MSGAREATPQRAPPKVREPGWNELRAFLAVMDEGSLSGAARVLAISQPTVRARIAALEDQLGIRLFTHAASGMVPTRQAEILLEHARAMQRASEALVRTVGAEPGEVAGTVRLSVSEFIGLEILPPILARLHARHPGLRLELSLSNRSANLLEREADIALRNVEPVQQALVIRKLPSVPLGFVAHPAYLASRGVPQTIEDLGSHSMIGPDRTAAEVARFSTFLPALPPARLALRTDSHPAQLAAATAGLGIAVAQVPVATTRGLVRVLPEITVGTIDTWIVTHEDLRHVPRIRAVLDHLAAALGDRASARGGDAPEF